MKKINNALFFLFIPVFLFACATSQQGTTQLFSIISSPSAATVKTSHGFSCPSTPCKIRVPRNKSFEVVVSKPGFTTEKVSVGVVPSGPGTLGVVGSAIVGGAVTAGYDLYRGGVFELSESEVQIKLENMSSMVLEEVRAISNMDLY